MARKNNQEIGWGYCEFGEMRKAICFADQMQFIIGYQTQGSPCTAPDLILVLDLSDGIS